MGNDLGRQREAKAHNNNGYRLLKAGSDLEGAFMAYSAALAIDPSHKLAGAGQQYAAAALLERDLTLGPRAGKINTLQMAAQSWTKAATVDAMAAMYVAAAEGWAEELGAGHEAPQMARDAAARIRRNRQTLAAHGATVCGASVAALPPDGGAPSGEVEMLMSMGFEQEQVTRALQAAKSHPRTQRLNHAMDMMLEGFGKASLPRMQHSFKIGDWVDGLDIFSHKVRGQLNINIRTETDGSLRSGFDGTTSSPLPTRPALPFIPCTLS